MDTAQDDDEVTHNPPDDCGLHRPSVIGRASAPVFRDVLAAQARGRTRCGSRRALAVLASIVVHEEWHLRLGSDERGAYEAQLFELTRLGLAFSPESTRVRRAMNAVLKRQAATSRAAALHITSPDP
jgi:hypothetical protein